VDTISVSEFKATCLAVIERVRQSGQAVLITKHGQPVAELVPPRPVERPGRGFLGRMKGELSIAGDLLKPVLSRQDWERSPLEEADLTAAHKPARRRR
jgi:prevent-host-death family protein